MYAPQAYAEPRCYLYSQGGGIQVKPPSEVGQGPEISLDIDGDGYVDFYLHGGHSTANMRFNHVHRHHNQARFQTSNGYIKRLGVSNPINAVKDSQGGSLAGTRTSAWFQSGEWNGGQTGYIAVRFVINPSTAPSNHEGWIKFRQTSDFGTAFEGYIEGWGYETQADTDLLTGAGCDNPTLVELSSFTAKGGVRGVILSWETTSEMEHAGFHLWRSENKEWGYERITEALIPAEGSTTQGAAYRFEDTAAAPGKNWFYKLEDVDADGNTTLHGPVSAWAGMVNIQVNGADGPVTVDPSEAVSVVVQARFQDNATAPKECWICCDSPFGWFSYLPPEGWLPGIEPCTVSPEQSGEGVKIFDQRLPEGIYTFYLALDGIIDGQPLPDWLDSVEVTVGE